MMNDKYEPRIFFVDDSKWDEIQKFIDKEEEPKKETIIWLLKTKQGKTTQGS